MGASSCFWSRKQKLTAGKCCQELAPMGRSYGETFHAGQEQDAIYSACCNRAGMPMKSP